MSDLDAFDALADELDYPMFVISATADGQSDACLVGFTTQCSIEPPRYAVFLSKANRTYTIAHSATTLIVHRLRADQHAVAEHFGGTSKVDDPGKLAEWPWSPGPEGAPVIADCDWFAGRIEAQFDVGDHVAFVLAPFGGHTERARQLGYQATRDIEAGQPAD
jgi:flavin reductase (DIM6/NTAB) family NADH-FMN oxidoreductase RutF